MNRELFASEKALVRWMLEQIGAEAQPFLDQLERAEVTPWRCKCGCASLNFKIQDEVDPPLGMRSIADFVFDAPEGLSGVFVYEQSGILSGLEVFGLAGDAPKALPSRHFPSVQRLHENPRRRLTSVRCHHGFSRRHFPSVTCHREFSRHGFTRVQPSRENSRHCFTRARPSRAISSLTAPVSPLYRDNQPHRS